MVVLVDEAFTTKTCCCCGKINNNVGCSETFKCSTCKTTIGRDVNAAKNILLKGIIKNL